MEDRIRLHEIEMELDRTDLWELSPYRNKRRKLNREKKRIIRRMKGEDPSWFAAGTKRKRKELMKMKREIVSIINEIEGGKLDDVT